MNRTASSARVSRVSVSYDYGHHEQTSSNQQRFQYKVHSLIYVFEKYGNLFTEESQGLIVLDS